MILVIKFFIVDLGGEIMLSKRFVKMIINDNCRSACKYKYGVYANKGYVYYLKYSLEEGWYKILRATVADAADVTELCQSTHYAGHMFDFLKSDKVEVVFEDVLIQPNSDRVAYMNPIHSLYEAEYYYRGELLCRGSGY